MADALRSLISIAARIAARIPAGIPVRVGGLLASSVLLHCGGGIQVAGGTSEVGNPSAIIVDNGKDEDTASSDVGVRFDFTGFPIQIIKEKKPETKASAEDSASASASVSSSSSSSSPETTTPSPAN